MNEVPNKPIRITREAFQRAYNTKSEETLQVSKLAVGQGLTFPCRWKHEQRTNVCAGRAFFRYAAKRLNMTLQTSHGDGTISVLRDK
jgi:hypothetical protein